MRTMPNLRVPGDDAWKAIYQYVFALSHGMGENLFYYGDWIKTPGVAICSCNDGLRPVIMKLEDSRRRGGYKLHAGPVMTKPPRSIYCAAVLFVFTRLCDGT